MPQFCLSKFRLSLAGKPVQPAHYFAIAFAVTRWLQIPCVCEGCEKLAHTVTDLLRDCYTEEQKSEVSKDPNF
jgi:hypothetical protein